MVLFSNFINFDNFALTGLSKMGYADTLKNVNKVDKIMTNENHTKTSEYHIPDSIIVSYIIKNDLNFDITPKRREEINVEIITR